MHHHFLLLDTSTDICSVAVANEYDVLSERIDDSGERKHAALLPLLIDSVLKDAGVNLHDISAIAYSKGPGSYTGLRVGLSSAKGMCYAKNIPLIGISTLEALAYSVEHPRPKDLIISMIDAGRNEVFQAVFTSDYKIYLPPSPKILENSSYKELIRESASIYIVGDGSIKAKNILASSNIWVFGTIKMLSSYLYIAAKNKFLNSDFEDLAYATPDYLKAPEYKKKAIKN